MNTRVCEQKTCTWSDGKPTGLSQKSLVRSSWTQLRRVYSPVSLTDANLTRLREEETSVHFLRSCSASATSCHPVQHDVTLTVSLCCKQFQSNSDLGSVWPTGDTIPSHWHGVVRCRQRRVFTCHRPIRVRDTWRTQDIDSNPATGMEISPRCTYNVST